MSISEAISQSSSDVDCLTAMENEIRGLSGFGRFQLPTSSDNPVTLTENRPLVSSTSQNSGAVLSLLLKAASILSPCPSWCLLNCKHTWMNWLQSSSNRKTGRVREIKEKVSRNFKLATGSCCAISYARTQLTLTFQVREITTHLVGGQWNHGTGSDSCDWDIWEFERTHFKLHHPHIYSDLKGPRICRKKELKPLSRPGQKLLIVTTSETVGQTNRDGRLMMRRQLKSQGHSIRLWWRAWINRIDMAVAMQSHIHFMKQSKNWRRARVAIRLRGHLLSTLKPDTLVE